MNTNEATTFANGKDQANKEQKNQSGWQKVTISGVTGILMGGGAMHVLGKKSVTDDAVEMEEHASVEQTENDGEATAGTRDVLKVAEVSQDLSFGEAFATARASVGAGGVFHWHGGIYNTYT